MKYTVLLPITATAIFFGMWQNDYDAGGFIFTLMLFACYVAEYLKGDS